MRVDALLARGEHDRLVSELDALVARHPLREELWARYLQVLYRTGRQADALGAYARARTLLSETLGVDPGPALRDMHARILQQDPRLDGPVTPTRADPLHARVSSFVGRDEQLRRGCDLLARDRLVTLTGAGGVGKTSLAIEIARSQRHPAGPVWVADLSTTTQPSRVMHVVATAVAGPARSEPGGAGEHRGAADRLIDAIGQRDALLVLDNCEQVLDACAVAVEHLLSRCRGLRVLATSRAPLSVPGETVLVVEPLGVDDGIVSPAVRLFRDRGRSADPALTFDRATLEAAHRIVRRLDGLPLAIELAAAQLTAISITELEERLDTRLRAPPGGTRPARQRTLVATLAWSHDLLDSDERAAFASLSVCSGGWTLPAAEALLGSDAVDLLSALVRKSLVNRVRRDPARYDMLGPVRSFAASHLTATARAVAHQRHARWCLDIAVGADRHLRGPERETWMIRLETEHENLRVALDWAAAHDHDLAVRLAGALGWFWFAAGHHAEGHTRLERALAASDELPAATRLDAARWAVALSWHHTDAAAAVDRVEQAEALASEVGDADALMLSQAIRAVLLHRTGRLGEADAARVASLTSAVASRSWTAGYVHLMAGMVDVLTGDMDAAVTHGTAALERFRPAGDPWAIAHTLGLLGAAERRLGNPDRARALLGEARELMAGAPASRGAVDVLLELGALAVERDDLDDADRYVRDAVDTAQTTGPRSRATALRALADLTAARGDLAAAAELRDRAAAAVTRDDHDRDVIISQIRDDIGADP